ncbi:MAG TPA: hypothetical protein DEA44_03105 [Firmicutes bacterium]|nr:hypothetical protein [Bacillota bacterium]
MITKELIERLNFLARKQKTDGLSEEEKSEQQKLRCLYIDCIKGRVKDTLDRVKFVDEEEVKP